MAKIDKNYILLLFKFNHFKQGIIQLSKIMESEQEILSIYMEEENFNQVLSVCENYSIKDKYLWVQAFYYIIQFEDVEKITPFLVKILEKISQKSLMSPLLVIQSLRKKKHIPIEIYKDYLLTSLKEVHSEITNDKQIFDNSYKNIRKIADELTQLKNNPSSFNVQQCALCNDNFSKMLSSGNSSVSKIVVFMCQHAFHPVCLNIQERQEVMDESFEEYKCPICTEKLNQINQRLLSTSDLSLDHNAFFRQLYSKNNKFDFIAKSIGKGMIKTDL